MDRFNMTWEGVVPEIKEKYKGQNISLLLGNGFTQALMEASGEGNVYDQKLIVEKILSQQRDEWNIFERLKKREDIKTVEELFVAVKTQLKNCFLEYLLDVNENFLCNFSDESLAKILEKCEEFFKPFGKFFTLNYDVVLYRLMIALMEKSNKNKRKFTDGFTKSGCIVKGQKSIDVKEFNSLAPLTVHYLHGAFHLLCVQDSDHIEHIIKAKAEYKTNGERGKTLIDVVRELQEMCPWFKWFILLEESAEKKLENIRNNYYLKHCFERFQEICGVLVTYGVRFGESDRHIFKEIVNNQKLKAVYVSYHSEEEKKRLEGNFEEAFKKKEEEKKKEKEKREIVPFKKPIIQYFSTKQNPFVEDTTNSTIEEQSSGAPSHLQTAPSSTGVEFLRDNEVPF